METLINKYVLTNFNPQFNKIYIDIDDEIPLYTKNTEIYQIGCSLLHLFIGCESQFQQLQYL